MPKRAKELSGLTVRSADVEPNPQTGRWTWVITTDQGPIRPQGNAEYFSALSAARSMVNELEKHSLDT